MIQLQVVYLLIDELIPVLRLVNVQLLVDLETVAERVPEEGQRGYHIDWVTRDYKHFRGGKWLLFR